MADAERTDPWWWLSFADADLPKGEQFLGVCIVQGTEPGSGFPKATDPVPEAWRRGVNPGGEVRMIRIPDGMIEKVPEKWRNRVLSRELVEQLDRLMVDA